MYPIRITLWPLLATIVVVVTTLKVIVEYKQMNSVIVKVPFNDSLVQYIICTFVYT